MIDRYTTSQINDFLRHYDDPFVFVATRDGVWGVGQALGDLTKSGNVCLTFAWELDESGELLRGFGNGDRGYYTYHRNVIAMFTESDVENARAFLTEMKRIDETYKDDCKAPLLKMQTSIAILQAATL